MDAANLISSMPSWALFGLIVLIGVLATQVGFRLGRRNKNEKKESTEHISTAVSAILGLLSFMLGFTFSTTSSRFAERKGLVISQANAIGTSYLRAGLLPENQKNNLRKLYAEYTDLLLKMPETENIEPLLNRRDKIHLLIWEQAISLEKEKDFPPAIISLFITSVNQIFDLTEERKTVALVFRIPDALWSALILLNAMSMFAYGYQKGIEGNQKSFGFPILPIAYAIVIVLIADMDSTSFRRFKVSQEPLINLQKMIRMNSE